MLNLFIIKAACLVVVFVEEGCPIHPICNGSPKWWRSVTGRDGSILFVSLRHVGGPSRSGRMVITVDSLSVRKRLRKHSWRCYGVGSLTY